MKVLIVEPMKVPYVCDIGSDLKSMQKIVDGNIQAIYPLEDKEVALICNDEGKPLSLPLNRALKDEEGMIYDIVAGTFFLCRASGYSERFEDLTEEQIKVCTKRFEHPEYFLRSSED